MHRVIINNLFLFNKLTLDLALGVKSYETFIIDYIIIPDLISLSSNIINRNVSESSDDYLLLICLRIERFMKLTEGVSKGDNLSSRGRIIDDRDSFSHDYLDSAVLRVIQLYSLFVKHKHNIISKFVIIVREFAV